MIDFAFPTEKLAVEIDGFGCHRDVKAFQHDRTRRNRLVAAGWTVLNYTWADLLERPHQVTS
ncbi:endonuclease domain-containing protein [Gordonia sp. (in: high G+C Gram-positive bacteria)]|uniref:endonuclease domain-containing protein n=1 Tax=Gordonia sp. (in: high G+C Gram-positive bacteria) TaxID=84139 RepID=UPI002FDA3650